jgi:hypothetical protein
MILRIIFIVLLRIETGGIHRRGASMPAFRAST